MLCGVLGRLRGLAGLLGRKKHEPARPVHTETVRPAHNEHHVKTTEVRNTAADAKANLNNKRPGAGDLR